MKKIGIKNMEKFEKLSICQISILRQSPFSRIVMNAFWSVTGRAKATMPPMIISVITKIVVRMIVVLFMVLASLEGKRQAGEHDGGYLSA